MQNLWDLRSKRVHVAVMRHGHVMIRVDAAWTRFMFEFGRFLSVQVALSPPFLPAVARIPFFDSSLLTLGDNIMFKSILPSRRVPSSDFQMLTSPIEPSETEPNGKENYFANPNTFYDPNAKPKTDKRKKTKGKLQQEQEAMPTEDFDKLLVSLHFASYFAYTPYALPMVYNLVYVQSLLLPHATSLSKS